MTTDFSLHYYLGLLRRRVWVLVTLTLLGIVGALAWSALQTPLYESSARILINQTSGGELFDPGSASSTTYAERLATNEVQLMGSELVLLEAQSRLDFEAEITVRSEPLSDVIVVTASDPDAGRARTIAQTFAEAYIDVRRNEFVNDRLDTAQKLLDRILDIDAEIDAAGPEADTRRQQLLRDSLADSYDRLSIIADLGDNGRARIIDTAKPATDPVSPRTNRNLLVGGLLGLIAGTAAAVLRDTLDNTVKTRAILEAITPNSVVLASIPVLPSDEGIVTVARPDGLESEAFRNLRAAIEFSTIDMPKLQVIQITSARPSAGKTTIAANLAVVMARAGKRVIVVDADLRRPRLHVAFNIEQLPGLSSLIIGRDTIEAVTHSVALENGQLRVVASGPSPPGPSELLGSKQARAAFAALRESADIIIVDSPPVLPVADALVLGQLADATIVVANSRYSNQNDLARAVERLEQSGAKILGTVLNQVKGHRSGRSDAGYGYGYGYGSPAGSARWFSRSRRDHAPRPEGTVTWTTDELPRFEAAPQESPEAAPKRDIQAERKKRSSRAAPRRANKSEQ